MIPLQLAEAVCFQMAAAVMNRSTWEVVVVVGEIENVRRVVGNANAV